MHLDAYQAATLETATYPGAGTGSAQAIAYVTLGAVSEAGELLDKWMDPDRVSLSDAERWIAGALKEVGDVQWYIARVSAEIGLPLSQALMMDEWGDGWSPWGTSDAGITKDTPAGVPATGVDVIAVVSAACALADKAKKMLRDEGGVLTDPRREVLAQALLRLSRATIRVARAFGADPDSTAAANLAKLASRKDRGVIGGSGDDR